MGLFASRKPKWQHKDPEVRLASIESIGPGETEFLLELIREDPDPDVRRAAINKLTDLKVLDQAAENVEPEDRSVIAARRDTLLYEQIVDSADSGEWQAIIDRIASEELMAELAVNADQPELRVAAVQRIDDQFLLAEILRRNCGKKPAVAAMEKITDEALLAKLSETAASKTSRRLAADKIAEMERRRNPVSEEVIIAQKLDKLVAEAAQLENSRDLDAAALRLTAIKEEWQDLDREYSHPAYDVFRGICHDFEKNYQEILEQRRVNQEKAARYEQSLARLNEICETIERLACATDNDAPAAKVQAEADWALLVDGLDAAIVPSASLTKRFETAIRAFDANREKIDPEKQRVAAIETECAAIRDLIDGRELNKAAARLAETRKSLGSIKIKYFNQAAIEKLVDDLAADLDRDQEEVRSVNLARRQEICMQVEELRQSEKYAHIEKQLQSLQQAWEQLEKLGGSEGDEFEQRFQRIVAELLEKLKTLEHEKDWELWANLKLKQRLTEQVGALDREDNLETVVNVIKQSQAEWKKIGPVPRKKSQRLWDAFQDACNRNFERAMPYLEELKTKKAEAMERRREICLLAVGLTESEDWQKTTNTLKGFQEEWKALPHGSRREEQKLYLQFREACDRFFARRKEHYRQLDEERGGNLTAKEKLCEEAEQLAADPQLDYPGHFKRLQSEWKKIGPVPRKNSDTIWKRFRKACDTYFNWLEERKQKNLKQKEEICEAAENLVAESTAEENRPEIAARLTKLQQQWKEIGPVPPDSNEAVWQRFREPCDRFFAARQQQFEKEEKERRLNQDHKEDMLARAEELAGRDSNKETTLQLKQLQKEWFDIGPAPREKNKELNDRFKDLCDAYFEGRRQYFSELKAEQLENQKKKESLCLRLENILGLSPKTGTGKPGKALSLAEELKQAMEDNFMLAGRRGEQKDVSGEVKRIRQEWDSIGPVPPKQIKPLRERYKKALDAYYESRRKRDTSEKSKGKG